MKRYDLSEARIYVGTYAKYNEGSLRGKWIDLSECYDQDEFMEVCHELHQDEEEPELMFQDWENIPEELIDEGWKSHTNLTHPGKYFRPSKVKIMRPTSPK